MTHRLFGPISPLYLAKSAAANGVSPPKELGSSRFLLAVNFDVGEGDHLYTHDHSAVQVSRRAVAGMVFPCYKAFPAHQQTMFLLKPQQTSSDCLAETTTIARAIGQAA